MTLTPAQFNFLRRIGSNNFNASTPTHTINSVIRLGLAETASVAWGVDRPNYYQITQAGAELLAKIEWERQAAEEA